MASIGASGLAFSVSHSHRRRTTPSTTPVLRPGSIKSSRSGSAISCKNPEPSRQSRARRNSDVFPPKRFNGLIKASAALGSGLFLISKAFPKHSLFGNGGGGGSGGGTGGGGGGGGGGDGGNFWSEIVCPSANAGEEESQEWDNHGLPANIVVPKLSGFKRYKLSDISFFDRSSGKRMGTEDSFFEMVSLRPGGVYTKAQLQKEVETLASSGMFEKVEMEVRSNPDGTINITLPFLESTWQSADSFTCINVGLMAQQKPIEVDSDLTEKEMIEYYKMQER